MLPIIQAPTHSLVLPTGERIKYRPFNVAEQKGLLLVAESGDQADIYNGIIELVDFCTFQKVDWMKQPAVNLEAAFLAIRSKAVGEFVEMKYKCLCKVNGEPCNHSNHIDADLRTAKHTEFPETTIKVTDDISLVLEHITVADTLEIFRGDLKSDDLLMKKTKMVINGEEVITEFGPEEFQSFADSFPVDARDRVESFFKNQSVLVLDIPTHCAKCHNDSSIQLKGVMNFFG